MKHKKNKPEHPLHFSKYNAPLRTRKRGIAFLHVLPSLFFQLEQQPLKPTSLSQGQALLALFLFLRRIKPVSSSGLIPCCPLYLECYPFHMALLVHLHPSDFTLSIPSPETPSLALVSKSTLSSLIWPSHNLPASFCPLPWTQFSIHCLLRLLELSSCLPPPKAAQHLSCWPSHCHLPAPRLHAWVNDWVTFGKVTLQNGVWGSSFFIHWLTGVLRKESQWLYKILWLGNWKRGDGLSFFAKPWGMSTLDFGLSPQQEHEEVLLALLQSISKDADVHFCALFHFLLYAFTLSFIAGMNNLASPVLRTKNTEASFCLRAPSPCQDCDRHFSGPPNKKSPALTLQLKE